MRSSLSSRSSSDDEARATPEHSAGAGLTSPQAGRRPPSPMHCTDVPADMADLDFAHTDAARLTTTGRARLLARFTRARALPGGFGDDVGVTCVGLVRTRQAPDMRLSVRLGRAEDVPGMFTAQWNSRPGSGSERRQDCRVVVVDLLRPEGHPPRRPPPPGSGTCQRRRQPRTGPPRRHLRGQQAAEGATPPSAAAPWRTERPLLRSHIGQAALSHIRPSQAAGQLKETP